MATHLIVISGCSAGGKSTLIDELTRRGHRTVPEPGRRVVAAELKRGGTALPWVDMAAFAHRAIAMALEDRAALMDVGEPVIFDRGLVDAVAALVHIGEGRDERALLAAHRYHHRVFLAPPWEAIYESDAERRHSFGDAVAEYDRLRTFYPKAGYDISILSRTSVGERADFIEAYLSRLG